MPRSLNLTIAIQWIALLILMSGCDERATHIAREAADRQAQQNTAMAELNKEVAGGTHQLVAADAQARKEIVGVHRDLQAERTRLDTSWSDLEGQRREIAGQRRTESMLAAITQLTGGVLLLVVLLGFCWYALVAAQRSEVTDSDLSVLLVKEILADNPTRLSAEYRPPTVLSTSDLHSPAN